MKPGDRVKDCSDDLAVIGTAEELKKATGEALNDDHVPLRWDNRVFGNNGWGQVPPRLLELHPEIQEEPTADTTFAFVPGEGKPAKVGTDVFRVAEHRPSAPETYGCEHCGARIHERHREDCPHWVGVIYAPEWAQELSHEEFLTDLRSSWKPPQADRIRRIFEANRSKEGFHAEPD